MIQDDLVCNMDWLAAVTAISRETGAAVVVVAAVAAPIGLCASTSGGGIEITLRPARGALKDHVLEMNQRTLRRYNDSKPALG